MIIYLEGLLLPRLNVTSAQHSPTFSHSILERPQLSLYDMALLPMYVDLGKSDTPSAYLTFDNDGNDLWVCHRHHRRLNPGFRLNYVKNIIKRFDPFGRFDAATGTIDVHLRTSKNLEILCSIDPIKVGSITELSVALDWPLSEEELRSLIAWSSDLGQTTLSTAGTRCLVSDV
ncbi:hypothetical protein BGX24_003351 [Mortierella sp. AD032]|nr:hypothetical protein BGX24_003351 [Mortierella sp. AD032]